MKRDIPQELPFDFCENCLMYDPKIDSTYLYAYDEKTVYNIVCRCENEAVCRNVKRLLKQQQEGSGWISVKDRLPNCNGIYLVWRPHYFGGEKGEPVVCYFDGQNTWHDSYGVDFERILHPDDVTHWMQLPEPPQEVEK